MKTLNIVALILVVLIVLISLLIILFKHYNEKINNVNDKLNDSEIDFYNKLKDKYNLIVRLINLVENKFKVESKLFEDVKKIKIEDLSTVKNDKLLNKCYKELIQIKEDNQKNRELKSFREIIDDYEENELHIISLRTYYNKYTLEYNNMIKKFPYNIVAKFKKYKIRPILEGKELSSNFNNDLEV